MRKLLSLLFVGLVSLTSCKIFSSPYADEKLTKAAENNTNPFDDRGGYFTGDEDEKPNVQPQEEEVIDEEPEEVEGDPTEEPKVEPPVSTDVTYEIRFEDGTGKELFSCYVYEGMTPYYEGDLPTKSASQYYKFYSFKGWVPAIVPAYKDQVYRADFIENYYDYTVRFFNDDEVTLLSSDEYIYGDNVNVPKNPTKQKTVSTSYVFQGWRTKDSSTVLSKIPTVTGDVDYYAVYKSSTNKYMITFKNEDGTILQQNEYEYGATPSYTMPTPTKSQTAGETYTFTGWQPSISRVIGDEVYVATFNSTNRQYSVRFLNDDGSLLRTVNVNYGVKPTYSGTPTKQSDAQYKYTFSKWVPDIQPYSVDGPQEYVASYTSVKQTYTVRFRNATDTADLQPPHQMEYGETPTYTGTTPTKAKEETSTAVTTYKFVGWNTDSKAKSALSTLPTVTNNLVFYPIFSSSSQANRTFKLKYSSYVAHLYEGKIDILESNYESLRSLINWRVTSTIKNIVLVENGRFTPNLVGKTGIEGKIDGCVVTMSIEVVDIKLSSKKEVTELTGPNKWHAWNNHVYMETSRALTKPMVLTYDLLNDKNWFHVYFSGNDESDHVTLNAYKPYEDNKAFFLVKKNDSYWNTKKWGEGYGVRFKIAFTKRAGNEIEVVIFISRYYSHYFCE